MRLSIAWATAVAATLCLLLGGCGAGDSAGVADDHTLKVTTGGSGSVFFPATQTSLSFSNSVTVAVRSAQDAANQFTVFTLFGLDHLSFNQVPEAALVVFVNGLSPTKSTTTDLPSSVVTMALHTGFDRSKVVGTGSAATVLAQDAPTVYELLTNGSFILEALSQAAGFTSQSSADRAERFSTVALEDVDSSKSVLVQGSVGYKLSTPTDQTFLGYAGNLGLLRTPSSTGGGPPPPPGGTGTGTGGSGTGTGTGSGDGPPAPPL